MYQPKMGQAICTENSISRPASDRAVILQALGVLDRDTKSTARLNVTKAVDVVQLTQKD